MATMLATTNPLREGLRTELTAEPCVVVIFGAVADVKPICLWRKEFGDFLTGNEMRQNR